MKRVSGFTLIESMVALVILAMVFASVWGWFSGAIKSTERIEQAVAEPHLFDEVIARLKTESLHEMSQGEYTIDKFLVRWSATPLRESSKEGINRQPRWAVYLYRINVQIYSDGQPVTEFSTMHYYQSQLTQAPLFEDMP